MTKPKATLKLMAEGYWGAKAMERRVIQCCADNPDCPFQEKCYRQYVKLVNASRIRDRKAEPGYKQSIATKLRNYHLQRQAGVPSRQAARQMTNRQTRLALETARQ